VRQLTVFNNVTLDGYIADAKSDMSWAHQSPTDAEWNAFVSGNAQGGGALLFGRVTYDLMASYWPTPMAAKNDPALAERMNSHLKVVFSRTLEKATWANTRLVKHDMVGEVRRLKQAPGEGLAILGSGQIAAKLASEGLIDEYQLVVIPLALGQGRTPFEGIKQRLNLKLKSTRSFRNGNVLLCYEPGG
jgi:dihydrofolate reductase